jgi:DNA-binding response OmpR family regulator
MNRIALIEDHSRLADLVRQALGHAGIETDVFHAMEPAWLALRDITYGVVVIDRGLPAPGQTPARRRSPHALLDADSTRCAP